MQSDHISAVRGNVREASMWRGAKSLLVFKLSSKGTERCTRDFPHLAYLGSSFKSSILDRLFFISTSFALTS